MERGGTMLGTTRCQELKTQAGQDAAVRQMQERGIEHLIVIGGGGSQAGAAALFRTGQSVVGLTSTIDNDIVGFDVTIGATTAVDVALESVDRLRVTAASHGRVFLVEVMGRDAGFIAASVGIASGAEVIVVPEIVTAPEQVAADIRAAWTRSKSHAIVVVAEGAKYDADALAASLNRQNAPLGFDLRVCRLGHVQRGGAPGMTDRLLATRLGAAAVMQLAEGRSGVLVGSQAGRIVAEPLAAFRGHRKPLEPGLLDLAHTLAL
jgi:6-phosphofructokinase 1